jgi:hypothetical protein
MNIFILLKDIGFRYLQHNFFSFGATAPILALAYFYETFRFTSVYYILDIR